MTEENNNGGSHSDWSELTGDVIVCCGGYEGRYQLDTVEAYSESTGDWTELPSMPFARDSMAAGSLGKVIVLAGGSDRKSPFDDVILFNWNSKEWSKGTPMPSARAYAASVMDESRGKLLISGGYNNVELNSCQAFEVETQKWLDLPNMPSARARSGGAIANDHFFVIGGDVMRRPTNVVDAFSIQENKWVNFPAMKSKRRRCAVVAGGDKIIVAGGLTSDDITLDSMEMFDMRNRKWMELPTMPCAKFGFSACVVGTEMFLLGGNERMKMKACCNRCTSFDLLSREWKRVPPMMYRRLHASGVKISV
ncbi:kelch domain-containing protein 8A-like isoform X2 [Actinia tenebrosa]|nr:kelch domain-containing protein 8A-like isoform X2 [Actinia tenebrosa]XP_031571970.1 kelch domain-containing protein 8A-like isoform X2 [Actinia tenebrosa]